MTNAQIRDGTCRVACNRTLRKPAKAVSVRLPSASVSPRESIRIGLTDRWTRHPSFSILVPRDDRNSY
jgi:hypothetical protein